MYKGVAYTIHNSTCGVSKLQPLPESTFCVPGEYYRCITCIRL